MHQSNIDLFKFTPIYNDLTHDDLSQDTTQTETHYSGGVGIVQKMREYQQDIQRAGSLEKHEFKEYENKVVPFSLYYEHPNKTRLLGGNYDVAMDVPVISEDMHNKLFFSVSQEMNEKGNRKTRKNK